jgi:hypothetical protein
MSMARDSASTHPPIVLVQALTTLLRTMSHFLLPNVHSTEYCINNLFSWRSTSCPSRSVAMEWDLSGVPIHYLEVSSLPDHSD